jgi:two-component system, NtrC family, response regulator AtoC
MENALSLLVDYLISGLFDSSISLDQIIDEIPIGIAVLDLNHRVILLNRKLEALTGFVNSEARSLPCKYILRSRLCQHGCPTKQLLQKNEPREIESDLINKNRQKIDCKITTVRLQDSNGKVYGFMELVEDLRHDKDSNYDHGPLFFHGKLIGKSLEMQRVFNILPAIAQTDSSVLITGETGTGKDFVAEAIHESSSRSKGPFIKVNCGALPENLLESELFGHEKGAFTGATDQKPGRFKLAHMGTLYLTEVGDLPLNLQVKLLSFLDDRVVHPLGSTKGINVNVRVIAATHRNLEVMARDGFFRPDLLFRLNVVRLQLPPLSKRGDDVRMLTEHFLQIFNSRFRKRISGFSDEAKKKLLAYHYPGNVRELRNIVEYSANICDGNSIRERHLPKYMIEIDPQMIESPQTTPQEPSPFKPSETAMGRISNWMDAERQMLMDAMIKARGRKDEAAKIMGIGRSTLWRKLKKHGIS